MESVIPLHLVPVRTLSTHAADSLSVSTANLQVFRRLQTLGLNNEHEASLLVSGALGCVSETYSLVLQELKDILLKQNFNKQL